MKNIKKYLKNLKKDKALILVLVIFVFELFLRFYQMDLKSPFGYDQVDNAWAAKNIIVNHEFPLVGMVAKGNSGIYIGPIYYYLISIIYFVTNLNPIASAIFAGLTSIFTFWTIFYVFKKLFSVEVAVIGVFVNTFMLPGIVFDRVQWPVNLIPGVSLLIFYVLYRITQGDYKKTIILALLVGFSFSVHFTSIFYLMLILLSLPLFPRNKEALKYVLISIPIFLIFLAPNVIYMLTNKSAGLSLSSYIAENYHGFHLRRVMQLIGDGFIQFNPYLLNDKISSFKIIAVPLFFLIYLHRSIRREKLTFCYLVFLWFVVPWFAFSAYRGEISDYYFAINRFVALFILSYFVAKVWMFKSFIPKLIVASVLIYIGFTNLLIYLPYTDNGLRSREKIVKDKIINGQRIEFQVGVPESYLYYYYMRREGVDPYAVKK